MSNPITDRLRVKDDEAAAELGGEQPAGLDAVSLHQADGSGAAPGAQAT